MRMILPSLRERKRYVLFQILGTNNLEFSDVSKAILSSARSFLGVKGLSKSAFFVMSKFWDSSSNTGVLRVNRGALDDARSVLLLTKEIKGNPCIVKSNFVSGTLKGLNSKVKKGEVF